MEYVITNLEKLLNISSPTGNTNKAINFVEKLFKDLKFLQDELLKVL